MRISVNQLLLILAFLMVPLPLLSPWLSFNQTQLGHLGLMAVQVLSAAFLVVALRQTPSRSLRVFWQYLSFALICAFAANLYVSQSNSQPSLLAINFLALFVYLFLFLAIETNAHLSDVPLNSYIAGRVPSVFFAVICFSYFVLLPLEFATSAGQAYQSTLLFHIVLSSVITVKLLWCFLHSPNRSWQIAFALLATASGLWMAKHIGSLNDFNRVVAAGNDVSQYLLSISPLLLVMASALTIQTNAETNTPSNKEVRHEAHILVLILLMTGMHLYGKEQQAYFVVDSKLQSSIVVVWLTVGIAMVLGISYRKRQQRLALKQQLQESQVQAEKLTKSNQALSNSLLNSEDKAIVGVSNNAILTTTVEGNILSANPAAVQMFQSLEQDLVGSNVSRLFAKNDEMHVFFDFESNVFSLQRKESGISLECTSVRSDGTEFPAQAELQWAEREHLPLIVITFINLSARKLAEKQALELKDKFIANISHEFRTPLTIINGIIDRYLTSTKDSEESQDLTTAKRNGLRLVRMVEQLLELSRVSDNPQLNLASYRLKTLMTMPVDSFQRLSQQSSLAFESHIPDDLWLECDAQAFEKIIFNLLANAVKYTPEGGKIQIIAHAEQDTIYLDVIDSGIGISKENQAKIFDRFQRADDPNNQAIFGVGIGLSLVNELVKAHGWRITVASEQGHGSKFTLSMPNAEPEQVEADIPIGLSENEVSSLLTEQPSASSVQVSHSHQVVLVIEDNADMQSHIKQVIEQKHHCILAGSGELGLQLASEYVPDLIVCDLMLTGIDGFEVLTQLKSDELTAHIPVILLTARSDLESRLQGLNLQADEYLSKPFNQHELLTRIQNLIDNRKNLQQRYLQQFNQEQKVERRATAQNNAAKMTEEAETPNLDEKFLAKLEQLIAKHYAEPNLDISLMANELAMSERQLQRKMKVMLDTTPNNFIKEFRLKKAQEMLHSGAQIGRIALDVGFSSQTYFGRCFKEAFGCTPKQYQQKLNESESA